MLSLYFKMAMTKICDGIYKINNDSNIYYLKDLNILIDCGNRDFYDDVKKDLNEVCNLDDISAVILTHFHYDHIGCFDLFKNAKFYCSGKIISDFYEDKYSYILNARIVNFFDVELHNIEELNLPEEFEIIYTPGHCKSGISIYDSKKKILYSGDTLFDKGYIGRYDLPKSNKDELKKSLNKLNELDYKILAPGHNY
jgi:glyoxylase-like metal-dependent hydrolase (beta-lactamase superfamily II)